MSVARLLKRRCRPMPRIPYVVVALLLMLADDAAGARKFLDLARSDLAVLEQFLNR